MKFCIPFRLESWLSACKIYLRRDILLVGCLGFSSGLPLLITLSTLGYWFSTLGVSKTSIGLFALLGLPYSLKFLWAPLIDKLPIPLLTAKFGRRRGWALTAQFFLIISIIALGFSSPQENLPIVAVVCLAISFFSATQDIVLDALRIELLKKDEQGAGAASYIGGYRLGMLLAGGGAIALSDYIIWQNVFIFLGAALIIGVVAVLYTKEPLPPPLQKAKDFSSFLSSAVIIPFKDFFAGKAAFVILLFIVLYKYGDAFGGIMATPFYNELGFSGTEIGVITKVWGSIATMAGIFFGGVVIVKYGTMWGLLIGGIAQAITNVFFIILSEVGKSLEILSIAISLDNITGGIGTVALVAYISNLCHKGHTATHYALLTSFAAFGRTFLSSGAGVIADTYSWTIFFSLTILLAIPALLIWVYLYRLDKKQNNIA